MKLSEILKRIKGEKWKEEAVKPLEEVEFEEKGEVEEELPPRLPSPIETYSKAITGVREMFKKIVNEEEYDITGFDEIIEEFKISINNDDQKLLHLLEKITPDNYLISHSVNVGILSLLLGNSLGYKPERLKNLCYASFLHDVGMVKVINIANLPRKLNQKEFMEIKKHVPLSSYYCEKFIIGLSENSKKFVIDMIEQVHERISGNGYPNGLKKDVIMQEAKLLAVSDIYEALIHPRRWRYRFLPHNAIKILINLAKTDISEEISKKLLEKLTVYPPGSYVRLNTNQIAKVIRVNPIYPTKPLVKIIVEADHSKAKEDSYVDLSTTEAQRIEEAVDETKIKVNDKKFFLKLRLSKWWIKSYGRR